VIEFGFVYFFRQLLQFVMLAKGSNMLGALLRDVRSKFRAIGSAVCLDLSDIFGAET
jgi:hypothetical protein